MKGLSLVVLFGIIGGLVGYLLVPGQEKAFSFVASAAAMAGYSIGDIVSRSINSLIWKSVHIAVNLILCVCAAFFTAALPHMGWAGAVYVLYMTMCVVVAFFSFFYLMPFAGVVVGKGTFSSDGK